ncbi:MAG: hypothetical protein FWH03_00935 [Firmicutes bacterium]|nr:hypothetical protein [Bacillota bacterium]
MSMYVKCTTCELNYVPNGTGLCKICDPRKNAKFLAAAREESAMEIARQERKEKNEKQRHSMHDFYAYRYDSPAKR